MDNLKMVASQKAAQILTGKLEVPPHAEKPGASEPEESLEDAAQEAAASKMISALQSKDTKQFTQALKESLEILGVLHRSSDDKEV